MSHNDLSLLLKSGAQLCKDKAGLKLSKWCHFSLASLRWLSLHLSASVVKAGPSLPGDRQPNRLKANRSGITNVAVLNQGALHSVLPFAFLYLSSPNRRSLEEALHYSPHPLPALT